MAGGDLFQDDALQGVCPICQTDIDCNLQHCVSLYCEGNAPPSGSKVVKVCTMEDVNRLIASELPETPLQLVCGHKMHAECLGGNLSANANTCPICRTLIAPHSMATRVAVDPNYYGNMAAAYATQQTDMQEDMTDAEIAIARRADHNQNFRRMLEYAERNLSFPAEVDVSSDELERQRTERREMLERLERETLELDERVERLDEQYQIGAEDGQLVDEELEEELESAQREWLESSERLRRARDADVSERRARRSNGGGETKATVRVASFTGFCLVMVTVGMSVLGSVF